MSHDAFAQRGSSNEEAYFRNKEAGLVERLRGVFEATRTKEELGKTSGITNDDVLERLVKLSVSGELLTVFRLYPLVEIAWADGAYDKAESAAAIAAAIKAGAPANGEAVKRLEVWLREGPTEDGRAAWKLFASELCKVLKPDELDTFRNDLLKHAREVAEASGGVLGVFFNVSSGEHRVLESIRKALTVK